MGRDRQRRRQLRPQLHRLDVRRRGRAADRARSRTRSRTTARAADVGRARRARQQPGAAVAAQPDRQHDQTAPRSRHLEGSRRTGTRTHPGGRARRGAPTPQDARSRPPDSDHRSTSRTRTRAQGARQTAHDQRGETIRGRLRHPRRRHLSRLETSRQARRRTASQHRHQRRRRHDPDPRPRNRPQSDLDDAANRLERRSATAPPTRLPHTPTSPLHGLRRDHRRRPRTLLLRRPTSRSDEARKTDNAAGTGATGSVCNDRSCANSATLRIPPP